jgi:hypothetical protein
MCLVSLHGQPNAQYGEFICDEENITELDDTSQNLCGQQCDK